MNIQDEALSFSNEDEDVNNGWTVIKYQNGDIYEGNMRRNKFHGRGKFTYLNGMYYDGYWKHGFEHGLGSFVKPGVLKYQGEWKNGDMCG